MSVIGTSSAGTLQWNLDTTAKYGIDVAQVRSKYDGSGVHVGVFDDGIVMTSALASALGASAAGTSTDASYGQHGTAVAGLLAGTGGIGVASGVSLTAVQTIGQSNAAIGVAMLDASHYDVTNSSFGWASALYVDRGAALWTNFFHGIQDAADHGRGGLGTVQVVAAGNYRASAGDANLSNFSNDRHVITVAATTSEGHVASYSNPGASLLVSAPSSGGTATILTTDLPGAAGFSDGDMTDRFGGTSAATPEVAGVVALMLQANAQLGWRDVSTILAATAVQLPGTGAVTNGATHWNGGGMTFSNDTGFGLVDASAAVHLAETWASHATSANELTVTATALGARALGPSSTISYGFDVTQSVSIESVEITLQGQAAHVGDLTVKLVSSSGTVSTLLSGVGGSTAFSTYTLESNAFRGELGAGHWTLQVTDAATGGAGAFTGATLAIHGGQADDHTFIFTDAYMSLAGRNVLTDASGAGVLDVAATTGVNVIDLHAGATSTIGGKAFHLAGDSTFAKAIGGAGDNHLIASDKGSILIGGDGNTVFTGGFGNDTFVVRTGSNLLDGNGGVDTAILHGNANGWTLARTADGAIQLGNAQGETDVLKSIEKVIFDDHTFSFDLSGNAADAYKLYAAALDRKPDTAGLNFWVDTLDRGAALKDIADYFAASPEFVANHAGHNDNQDFVTSLYTNTLQRGADVQGLQFWTGHLDAGHLDRADVLLAFSASSEFNSHVTADIHAGIMLA